MRVTLRAHFSQPIVQFDTLPPHYILLVTLIKLIACTGRSITQANTSAATGSIRYVYLKFSIMGQQLVHSGYVRL